MAKTSARQGMVVRFEEYYAMPNTLRTAERAYGMYDSVYQRKARYSRTTKTRTNSHLANCKRGG